MAPHVSHFGVHDHGFNNVSTYGNLLRLMAEGRIAENAWERDFYELALKLSGAVQARRWTPIGDGGYIYSFNGPHSLFVDTIRSLRVLAVAHRLGHVLLEEDDRRISLLARLKAHAAATATWSVYYGNGRDAYDVRGRVAHEAIFNVNDGSFRCPSSQQGYSPFSTWTRGLAWAICGFAEQLEFLEAIGDRRDYTHAARRRPGDLRFLHRSGLGRGRHPLLGYRRAESRTAGRLARGPPTRSIPTSRSTVRRRPSPRRGCCGWGDTPGTERYWQAGLTVWPPCWTSRT